MNEIPDIKLERFLLDELDEEEMEGIRRVLAGDEALRRRLEALRASNEEILREYAPERMGRRIRDRLAASSSMRRRSGWRQLRRLAPLAAAAILVIALLTGLPERPGEEGIRLKGDAEQLRVYRETEGGSEQLSSGDRASERDVILLQYQAREARFGAILSLDGRGTVTQHLPEQGSDAVVLDTSRARFLEHAYELDDAPMWELFFLVTAPQEFSLEPVIHAIETASPATAPRLPDSFRVTTFTLVKEAGR